MKNNYLYSVSNIKVAENRMLRFDDFLNMASCNNCSEVIDYLIRTGYFKEDDKNRPAENVLNDKRAQLLNKLYELGFENINMFYDGSISPGKSFFLKQWCELLQTLKGINVSEENVKIQFLREHKHDVFGIAPIFGYFYGTLIEHRNIRTILSGLRIKADKNEIIERLCMTYA